MEAGGLDLALMVFDGTEGAERAYADAPDTAERIAWAREIAFVEHHRRDRLVVRGTFAGHYVYADDAEGFIGPATAEGALGGAALGALLGPPGFAAGMVVGGIAGSVSEERSGPQIRTALFDEVRTEVPEASSAVILLAPAAHVDAMIGALDGRGGRLVRHQLSADGAQALRDAVADSPSASPAP